MEEQPTCSDEPKQISMVPKPLQGSCLKELFFNIEKWLAFLKWGQTPSDAHGTHLIPPQ